MAVYACYSADEYPYHEAFSIYYRNIIMETIYATKQPISRRATSYHDRVPLAPTISTGTGWDREWCKWETRQERERERVDHERENIYIYIYITRYLYNSIEEAGPGLFPSGCQTAMTDGRGRCRYNVVIEWSGGRSSVIVSTAISFDWNDIHARARTRTQRHRGNLIWPGPSSISELLSTRVLLYARPVVRACSNTYVVGKRVGGACGSWRPGVEVWRLKNRGSRGELFRASFNARRFLGNWSGWERRSVRAIVVWRWWGNRCSARWERREELMKPRIEANKGKCFPEFLLLYMSCRSSKKWG